MKKYFLFLLSVFVLSCERKNVEITSLDIPYTVPNRVKVEYFEIDNYNDYEDKELLNEMIRLNYKNIKKDSIESYLKYEVLFYEKHFYNNYVCEFDPYYRDSNFYDFPGFEKYLLSNIIYYRIDRFRIEKHSVLYKRTSSSSKEILLKKTDTIFL